MKLEPYGPEAVDLARDSNLAIKIQDALQQVFAGIESRSPRKFARKFGTYHYWHHAITQKAVQRINIFQKKQHFNQIAGEIRLQIVLQHHAVDAPESIKFILFSDMRTEQKLPGFANTWYQCHYNLKAVQSFRVLLVKSQHVKITWNEIWVHCGMFRLGDAGKQTVFCCWHWNSLYAWHVLWKTQRTYQMSVTIYLHEVSSV